jgi:4-hydroxybutyrate CoA-transferase
LILKKLSWVNSPAVISQIPNMISMNSCLGVDLRGQVCSESLSMGNTGGIGGQLDFVEGARKAPSGQSYLAMHSAVTTRSGERLSKITLTLPSGSVVTTPAADVMNVVTEFGVAELWGKSVKERAQNLIRIAHPEFRETLTYDAKKHGLM